MELIYAFFDFLLSDRSRMHISVNLVGSPKVHIAALSASSAINLNRIYPLIPV